MNKKLLIIVGLVLAVIFLGYLGVKVFFGEDPNSLVITGEVAPGGLD